MTPNWHKISFGDDEYILESKSCDNCTILWIYLKKTWNCTLMKSKFMVCELYNNKAVLKEEKKTEMNLTESGRWREGGKLADNFSKEFCKEITGSSSRWGRKALWEILV